jgi:hypothetical protein
VNVLVLRVLGGAAVALMTTLLGWWAPAIWGALLGMLMPRARIVRAAAISASLGWAFLLILPLVRGGAVGALATRLGAVFGIPAWALVAVTIAFPAVLAASAAWLIVVLRAWRRDRDPATVPGSIMRRAA